MSDSFVYPEFNKYYKATNDRKSEKSSGGKSKILKIMVVILTVVLITEVLLYTIILPYLSPVHIHFSGLENLKPIDLLNECGIKANQNLMSFNEKAFESKLYENSIISDVKVFKKFPDQVLVLIEERTPVVQSLITVNGKTIPVQIDKKGVVFKEYSSKKALNIPLVTGLEIETLSDGMYIAESLRPLIDQIVLISESNPVYFSALSEIHVKMKSNGNYELILFPIHSRTRVLTDRSLNEEMLQYMMVVLDVINSVDPSVTEVDMRYGSVSYKTGS